MKKNSLLILTLSVLMLTACGGTSSQTSSSQSPVSSSGSSESVSTDSTSSPTDPSAKLQASIDALSGNNFTTKYFMGTQTSEKDAFYTYRDNRYFFDTYNQTGYIALEDNTVYEFNVYNDVAMLQMPYLGMYDTVFAPNFEVIDFSVSEVGTLIDETNGIYQIKDAKVMEMLSHALNLTIYYEGEQYADYINIYINSDDQLTFALYTKQGNISYQAIISDVGTTTFAPAENYLEKNISPETEVTTDTTLKDLFGTGDFTATIDAKDYYNGYGFVMKLGHDYYYYPDSQDSSGSIVLSDGYSHPFTIANNTLTVDYDYDADEAYYRELFSLGRVDYSKFTKTGENTFVTRDYFNVKSFANYLSILETGANTMQIVVNEDKTCVVTFYNDASLIATVNLSDINSLSVPLLDEYLKSGVLPTLPSNKNTEALVTAFANLTSFTATPDSDSFMTSLTVTDKGRYETWSYSLSREQNYIKSGDNYYPFWKNGSSYEIDYTQHLTAAEYEKMYSLKDIDFSTFYYLGDSDGRYYSSSSRHVEIFSKMLSVSSYSSISAVYITLLEDGGIKVELIDNSLVGAGSAITYTLTNINTTTSEALTTVEGSIDETLTEERNNQSLVNYFNLLESKSNFRVHYFSTEADEYTDDEDDFYTEDTYYSGYYGDGVAVSDSGYLYEFREEHEDYETGEIVPFAIGSHPLDYESIFDYTGLGYFAGDVLNDYVLDGETYYTYDFNDIMVMCSFLYMSPDYIDKMTFEILDNDALHITFYSRDYLTDEETGTLLDSYEYNLYAEVEIRDVGTTTLPADGVYPTLLK